MKLIHNFKKFVVIINRQKHKEKFELENEKRFEVPQIFFDQRQIYYITGQVINFVLKNKIKRTHSAKHK